MPIYLGVRVFYDSCGGFLGLVGSFLGLVYGALGSWNINTRSSLFDEDLRDSK